MSTTSENDYPGVPFEKETDVMEQHHNFSNASKINDESGNEKAARIMYSEGVDQSIRKTALDTAMANSTSETTISELLANARLVEFYLRGDDGVTRLTPP